MCAYRLLSYAVIWLLQAECASALQMVDVIIGKVISSMVIIWLLKSITRIPNSFMV
jgi:hypothetical protein